MFALDLPQEKQRNMIAQAIRFGRPLPDSIKNAPFLKPGLTLYYVGFFDLESERQLGFGCVGNIPTTAILRYCQLYDFDDDITESFLFLIRKMDSEYLKFSNSRQKGK